MRFCDLKHITNTYEPQHEISNNVVFANSIASDQPAHTRITNRYFSVHGGYEV